MFHNIPQPIQDRMAELETVDARDRLDGTSRIERLRQVPPESGRFLALMAASAPAGEFIEIGTSAGYSTMWISLAMRGRTGELTTFEVLPEKLKLARETFRLAGIDDQINLVDGDAREHIRDYQNIAFCFLDAEKEIYLDCYDLVIPRLLPGGLFLADNIISHQAELQPFVNRAYQDQGLDVVIVPIGKGLLLGRKVISNQAAVEPEDQPNG